MEAASGGVDVEAALHSTALSAMAALQQGIVHTEQKLQQCLNVLGSVQADVATYKHAHLASIQDAYRRELQTLTDAYEQQVRDLQTRTQARVAQLQAATDSAMKQASELLLQELQPGALQPQHLQLEAPPRRQQQEQLSPAAELSLAAMQSCGSRPPGGGSSRRGSILDDVPLHPGTRSDCSTGSPGLWQEQQQHKAGGDQGGRAADTALHDQGSSLQPQSCIELLASLEALRASRRSSQEPDAATASGGVHPASACSTPASMRPQPFGTPHVSATSAAARPPRWQSSSSMDEGEEVQQQRQAPSAWARANPCPPQAPRPQQHQPPIAARRHSLRRGASTEQTLRHARQDREELELQLQAGLVRSRTAASNDAPALASGCSSRRASRSAKSLPSSSTSVEDEGRGERHGWRELLAARGHETAAAAVRSTLSGKPAAVASRFGSFRSSSLLDLL